MKTAVSVPDNVFERAEKLARRMRKSRSRFYSDALVEYVARLIAVPLTSNLQLAGAPGNVALRARATGLPKDSVANVSQIITIGRQLLTERTGHISRSLLQAVLFGIDVVLGRENPSP
jgi:mRNA interferase MazF